MIEKKNCKTVRSGARTSNLQSPKNEIYTSTNTQREWNGRKSREERQTEEEKNAEI